MVARCDSVSKMYGAGDYYIVKRDHVVIFTKNCLHTVFSIVCENFLCVNICFWFVVFFLISLLCSLCFFLFVYELLGFFSFVISCALLFAPNIASIIVEEEVEERKREEYGAVAVTPPPNVNDNCFEGEGKENGYSLEALLRTVDTANNNLTG